MHLGADELELGATTTREEAERQDRCQKEKRNLCFHAALRSNAHGTLGRPKRLESGPAIVHPSTKDRLGVWLATFVGGIVLCVVLEVPRWIPEWEPYVDLLVVCLVTVSAAAGILSFNAARRRFGRRLSAKWRYLAYFFSALIMFAVWSFAALIAAFAAGGGLFAATYSQQFHFAELDTTIYLYNSSFLDPETTVYVRRGWLPLREQVMTLGKSPDSVRVTLNGNVVMIDHRALDLRNR